MMLLQKIARTILFLIPVIPFIVLPVFAPYITTKLVLLGLFVACAGIVAGHVAYRDENFAKRLQGVVTHPLVITSALFIGWIFLRSFINPTGALLWGSFERNEGVYFLAAALYATVLVAAFFEERSFQSFWKWFARAIGVITFGSLLSYLVSDDTGRFFGTVGNPLYLSGVLLIVPFALRFIPNLYERIFIAAVTIAALYFADTRGVFLAIAVLFGFLFVTEVKFPVRVRSAGVAIGLVACVGIVIGLVNGNIPVERISTIQTRLAMWQSGFSELKNEVLLGYGLHDYVVAIDRGASKLQLIQYTEITNTTHNGLLDIALQGGLIGLSLFLVALAVGGISLYRLGGNVGRFAVAYYLSLITLALTSFFSIWFSLPLVILCGAAIYKQKKDVVIGPLNAVRFGFIGISKVVAVASLFLLVSTIYGSVYTGKVAEAFGKKQFLKLPTYAAAPSYFAYSEDWFLSVLRLSMPQAGLAVMPSYERFVQSFIAPRVAASDRNQNMEPQHAYVYATWSSFYANAGLAKSWDEWAGRAVTFQELALLKNPNRPSTAFALADFYREVNRLDDAVQLLKKTVEQNPELPEARLFYAVMLDIVGDYEGTERESAEAIRLRPLEDWSEDRRAFLLGEHGHDH